MSWKTHAASSRRSNKWFHIPQPVGRPELRLFCFPYAGGSATAYHSWPQSLPARVEMCAIQLPGRAFRLSEAPFVRAQPLIEALDEAIQPMTDVPFVFFGHSMGAMLAFELMRIRRRRGATLPRHLMVSGRRAPQIPDRDPPIHGLPRAEFLIELRKMNGTPEAVFENPELIELVLPALRADFELIETWSYTASEPFSIPITAFGGLQDEDVPEEDVDAWRLQTRGGFSRHMLPGDHFFMHSEQKRLLELVGKGLGGE